MMSDGGCNPPYSAKEVEMRKLGLIFLLSAILFGCTHVIIDSVHLSEEKIANVGDVFFEHKEGVRGKVSASRFVLTIVELNNKNIGLQSEDYIQMQHHLGTRWDFQGGKRIDYDISDKVIRFKGYEFNIVSVDKGQIKYKRIK